MNLSATIIHNEETEQWMAKVSEEKFFNNRFHHWAYFCTIVEYREKDLREVLDKLKTRLNAELTIIEG